MLKKICFLLMLFHLPVFGGSHYYEGGSYFVTGLNKEALAKEDVEVKFAVRPPSMMCGVYGTVKAEIKGFKNELRQAAGIFLKPSSGPALLVFYCSDRVKLLEEYPDLKIPHDHREKAPKKVILGDKPTETYQVGVLTSEGFFIYKEGKFVRSFFKDHKGGMRKLIFYSEYLQDTTTTFYPRIWGCQISNKKK